MSETTKNIEIDS